jgi:hypothetical protein
MLIFDIETGPLDEETVRRVSKPYQKQPHPGSFDPNSVKYGNTKDQAKRDLKFAECREAHQLAVDQYEQSCVTGETEYWQQVMRDAALSPITGQVLAIGLRNHKGDVSLLGTGGSDQAEEDCLCDFWKTYTKMRAADRKMIGLNISGFDLPFLVRRSWLNGVDVPASVRSEYRYWDKIFVDLRDVWLCGQRWGEVEWGLDHIARALGVGAKTEGICGGDFARLYNGTAEERTQAINYLRNDLEITARVAERLGVI